MKSLDILYIEYRHDSSVYFKRFRHMRLATFLDSCAPTYKGEHGQYDIITANPSDVVSITSDGTILTHNYLKGTTFESRLSPFETLSKLLNSICVIDDTRFPFTGGILGFWSYELGSLLEKDRVIPKSTTSNLPLMCVGLFWWALITDHNSKKTVLIFHPDIERATKSAVLKALYQPDNLKQNKFKLTKNFLPTISPSQYNIAFDRIQKYISAGDCYEVNFAQEFIATYSGDSLEAYLHLRTISPAPYSAYLTYPDITILCHSPECFIQVNNRSVETHPIKGTIARGKTPEEDMQNAKQLQCNQKDLAENLMIVDLMRNDLGKVCEIGSIQVPQLFNLQSYANVHHLVSTVTGKLSANADVFDLMANVFPGGSITGAPKIRSMEIISQLEVSPRSVYCGSIGYASCNGKMDTNIAIRTMIDYNDKLHCWGGGAIVADSCCEQEYEESIIKVKNLMSALNLYSVT